MINNSAFHISLTSLSPNSLILSLYCTMETHMREENDNMKKVEIYGKSHYCWYTIPLFFLILCLYSCTMESIGR